MTREEEIIYHSKKLVLLVYEKDSDTFDLSIPTSAGKLKIHFEFELDCGEDE